MPTMDLRFFDKISVEAPKERIYGRLGYVRDKTSLSGRQERQTNGYISQAKNTMSLRGAAARMRVSSCGRSRVILEDGVTFLSYNLAATFAGCREFLLMGVTAGREICNFIKSNSAGGDTTAAVIYDAVASETVDVALGWIADFYRNTLRRAGMTVTAHRFSCGYGDFKLENQQAIYTALQLGRLGVDISSDYILVPEKSVTAVAGIRPL